MFLLDWFWGVLSYLGLYNKSGQILFLGLDNAGKTTLLSKLKDEKLGQYEPTKHPNREELTMGSITFTAVDLGGHELARRLWREYYHEDIAGVVFIVDAADNLRFVEAKTALEDVLEDEGIRSCPVLILGNKIDKRTAVNMPTLAQSLGIGNALTGKTNFETRDLRPMELFPCSILNAEGYGEGFQWLAKFMD